MSPFSSLLDCLTRKKSKLAPRMNIFAKIMPTFRSVHCLVFFSSRIFTLLHLGKLVKSSQTSIINKIKIRVKVCHSSTFQTISRRSVYIKNINYNRSILAKNNTIQTRQHATKNPNSYSNRNNIYLGLLFVEEGSLAENV